MSQSRQYLWALRKKEAGLCRQCGKNPLLSKNLCCDCMIKRRKYQRKLSGHKAWKPGGQGRPPLQEKQ